MPQRQPSTLQSDFHFTSFHLTAPVYLGQLIERDGRRVLLANREPSTFIHILVGIEPDPPGDFVIGHVFWQLVDGDGEGDKIVRVVLVYDLLEDIVGDHGGGAIFTRERLGKRCGIIGIIEGASLLNCLAGSLGIQLVAAPDRYPKVPAPVEGGVLDGMAVHEDGGAIRILHDPRGAMVYQVLFCLLQEIRLMMGSHIFS